MTKWWPAWRANNDVRWHDQWEGGRRDLRGKTARRAMTGMIVRPDLSVQHAWPVVGGYPCKVAVAAIAAVVAARAA